MQSRVADLIERCQDEIVLESTLQINDELNSVFVRYERYTTSQTSVSGSNSRAPLPDIFATEKLCSSHHRRKEERHQRAPRKEMWPLPV